MIPRNPARYPITKLSAVPMPTAKNGGFTVWMAQVDRNVAALCGMSAADLSDAPYRDWHEDGASAASAAKRAIRNTEEG